MRKAAIPLLLMVVFAVALAADKTGPPGQDVLGPWEWTYWYAPMDPATPYVPPTPSPWRKDVNVVEDCSENGATIAGPVGYWVRLFPNLLNGVPRKCHNWFDIESLTTYICPPVYADQPIHYAFELWTMSHTPGDHGAPDQRMKYQDGVTIVPAIPFDVQIADIWYTRQVPHIIINGHEEPLFVKDTSFWVHVKAIGSEWPGTSVHHWHDPSSYGPAYTDGRTIWNSTDAAPHFSFGEELPATVHPRHGVPIIAAFVSKHDYYPVIKIPAANSSIPANTPITPTAWIYTRYVGHWQNPDYGKVHFWITPVSDTANYLYRETINDYQFPLTGHNVATFPQWAVNVPPGDYYANCYADFPYDWQTMTVGPKRQRIQFTVYSLDVGVNSIERPSGTYTEGDVVAPKAQVENFGSVAATFNVRFWIPGTSYDQTKQVTDLAPGATLDVEFDDFVMGLAGNYTGYCRVSYTGDMNPANDEQNSPFEIVSSNPPLVDVGVTAVTSPTGTIRRWCRYPLKVTVKNFGDGPATFPVVAKLYPPCGGPFTYTAQVTDLAAGAETEVQFVNRRYLQRGTWRVHSYTELVGDMDPSNDAADGAFVVRGCRGWLGAGMLPGPVKKTGAALATDGLENYYVLMGKYDPRIFHFSSEVDVAQVVSSVPENNGRVGKGTAMIYLDGKLYVLVANKNLSFQALDLASGVWSPLANLPAVSGRAANAGAALTVAGGKIYAVKGNKTTELFVYNPAVNEWRMLANLPSGKFNAGAALAASGERLFAFAGGTSSFWTYSISDNTWQELAPLPTKAKAGASLAFYNGLLYATAGNGNKFYSYDLAANVWTAIENVPSDPRNKKVQTGANLVVLDGSLLLLKGAKSVTLYAYEPEGEMFSANPTPVANVATKTIAPNTELALVANPVNHVARINLPANTAVKVNVYTTGGRMVKSFNTNECDVSSLANGVYLMKVTTNTATTTLRLVVEH